MRGNLQYWIRPGAAVLYMPGFLSALDADPCFTALTEESPWHQGELTLFGKTLSEPRLTAWCGERGYTYSRRFLKPTPWTPALAHLRARVRDKLQGLDLATHASLNHALLNYYRDGADGMGWHRDNEPELGPDPVVVSVSFGAPRQFVLRPRDPANRHWQQGWALGHGDLLVMYGATQRDWEHALKKTTKACGPRLNVTFRTVLA